MPHERAPGAGEAVIVRELALAFFQVVPRAYATHCALASRIAVDVLDHFGVTADLLPCQLWHQSRDGNHVIGFLGNRPDKGKWDGHVVCATGTMLLDAAIRGLHRDFGLDVPQVVVAPLFNAPSHVIARRNLNHDDTLWWHNVPYGADPTPPHAPDSLIRENVARLVAALEARLVRGSLSDEGVGRLDRPSTIGKR